MAKSFPYNIWDSQKLQDRRIEMMSLKIDSLQLQIRELKDAVFKLGGKIQ